MVARPAVLSPADQPSTTRAIEPPARRRAVQRTRRADVAAAPGPATGRGNAAAAPRGRPSAPCAERGARRCPAPARRPRQVPRPRAVTARRHRAGSTCCRAVSRTPATSPRSAPRCCRPARRPCVAAAATRCRGRRSSLARPGRPPRRRPSARQHERGAGVARAPLSLVRRRPRRTVRRRRGPRGAVALTTRQPASSGPPHRRRTPRVCRGCCHRATRRVSVTPRHPRAAPAPRWQQQRASSAGDEQHPPDSTTPRARRSGAGRRERPD